VEPSGAIKDDHELVEEDCSMQEKRIGCEQNGVDGEAQQLGSHVAVKCLEPDVLYRTRSDQTFDRPEETAELRSG
jgi:hypothetical protein